MFRILLGNISHWEFYLITLYTFCLWGLPIINVLLTIINLFKPHRGLRIAVYILSVPTIVLFLAALGYSVFKSPTDTAVTYFTYPVAITIACFALVWYGGKSEKQV